MKNYSQLENGHLLDYLRPIGSYVRTQWGLRRVVNHVRVPFGSANHISTAERALNVQ